MATQQNHLLRLMALAVIGCSALLTRATGADRIPLPEHPRPDFQRSDWLNLNGNWQFRFDADNQGLTQAWCTKGTEFPLTISVPFPWGSKLSGVADQADIG